MTKKKVQNLYFFNDHLNTFKNINENPKNPLYGKFTKFIEDFGTKYYTNHQDYNWRYNL